MSDMLVMRLRNSNIPEMRDAAEEIERLHEDCADKDRRIADLEAAIANLNTKLNELWGRDDCSGIAQLIGARMLDAIFDAQNKALCLTAL